MGRPAARQPAAVARLREPRRARARPRRSARSWRCRATSRSGARGHARWLRLRAGPGGPLLQGVPGRAAPARARRRLRAGARRHASARRARPRGALLVRDRTAALVLGTGGETVRGVASRPLDLVAVTRETLGLARSTARRSPAWAVLWLARLARPAARRPAARRVRALRPRPLASALAAMALSGWPLGLLFRVSAPEVLEGQKFVNDAAYLVEQSGPLLWMFAAIALARLAATPGAVACAIAARPAARDAGDAAVRGEEGHAACPTGCRPPWCAPTRALERVSQPGDVVLQRPGGRYPPAPVILAGRRVPYERFTPYLTQFAIEAGARGAARGRVPLLPHARPCRGRRHRSLARTPASSPSTAATACASTRTGAARARARGGRRARVPLSCRGWNRYRRRQSSSTTSACSCGKRGSSPRAAPRPCGTASATQPARLVQQPHALDGLAREAAHDVARAEVAPVLHELHGPADSTTAGISGAAPPSGTSAARPRDRARRP